MSALPSVEEFWSYLDSLSNWGRWGDDDQLGTLNLITPEKRVQAAHLVRDGTAISLANLLDPKDPDRLGVGSVVHRYMESSAVDDDHPLGHNREYLGLIAHGSNTHLDALSHVSFRGRHYNNVPAAAVTSTDGATRLSVHVADVGVTTRGVLLDATAVLGVDALRGGEGVGPDVLQEAERRQGVRVEPGDALMLYTGNFERIATEGVVHNADTTPLTSGYSAAALPWLHERGVALLSCDSGNDVWPSGYAEPELMAPVHTVGIVSMGLWLVDNMVLLNLRDHCRQIGRWEFLFNMSILKIVGSTSSPVNPVAIF